MNYVFLLTGLVVVILTAKSEVMGSIPNQDMLCDEHNH